MHTLIENIAKKLIDFQTNILNSGDSYE